MEMRTKNRELASHRLRQVIEQDRAMLSLALSARAAAIFHVKLSAKGIVCQEEPPLVCSL